MIKRPKPPTIGRPDIKNGGGTSTIFSFFAALFGGGG
jgi:hypothetical protein